MNWRSLLWTSFVLLGAGGLFMLPRSQPAVEARTLARAASIVTLGTSADASVGSVAPDANAGDLPSLTVGTDLTSGTYHSLLRFDLSSLPKDATITSAKLMLPVTSLSSTTLDLTILPIQVDWNEAGVTWNTQPSVGASFVTVTLAQPGPFPVDLTKLANGWVADPSTNFGIMLQPPLDRALGSVNLDSREAAGGGASLEIEYALPLPDLVVTDMQVTTQSVPVCSDTNSPLGVRVTFQNVGAAPAGPFAVDVNGAQQQVANGLGAGASDSLWFAGYVVGTGQQATVDVANQIAESDEQNNAVLQQVAIPTQVPTCTPTATDSPTVTNTALPPTSTDTSIPTATATPSPSPTTRPFSPTRTGTNTRTATATRTPPATVTDTATSTTTPIASQSPIATRTSTATRTPSATRTATSTPAVVGDPQLDALRLLEQQSRRPPTVRFENGLPSFLSAEVPVPAPLAPDPLVRAMDFLERFRALYRLDDPQRQLFLDSLVTTSNGYDLIFGQQQDGVPIYGAQLALHLENGAITGTSGRYLALVPQLPPASIRPEAAVKLARAAVPGTDVEQIGEVRPAYFDHSLIAGGATDTHLAWRILLRGKQADTGAGAAWLVFIDAHHGSVLFSLDQSIDQQAGAPAANTQFIRTSAVSTRAKSANAGKEFDIETANNTLSSTCWNLPGETLEDDWFTENGPTSGYDASADTNGDGQQAFNDAHTIYDYFFNNFGRRSYNGKGERVEVMVHVGTQSSLAVYSRACDQFQFGDGRVALDVFAREYTLAMIASSTDLGATFQAGALAQSYADVFAALVSGTWTIGESQQAGGVVDLSDPPRLGDPDHILPTQSGDGKGLRTAEPADAILCSNGDGHSQACGFASVNSGIVDKAAYLIAEGGTHKGITVTGIGKTKMQRLYYDVLTTRLTRQSQFQDARDATVDQAMTYVRKSKYGFGTADVCGVIGAFVAVGLDGPRPLDCPGLPISQPDDDGDYSGGTDNCPGLANPGQIDTDRDNQGDACDPDRDNDGVVNANDNCLLVANSAQSDDDGDGVGEQCDDNDGDGLSNSVDDCPLVSNSDQLNTDDDRLGNACDSDDDNDALLDAIDTCPLLGGASQNDADKDGVGNACDNSPTTPNPNQSDIDGDGIGDVTDNDIDDDGVANRDDGCPLVRDPYQLDLDKNGIGLACDEDEQRILAGNKDGALKGSMQFIDTGHSILIPVNPCNEDDCPDWLSDSYDTSVSVTLPFPMPARIVDSGGLPVTKAAEGTETTLTFQPDPEFFYRSPNKSDVYQGERYYLEVFAAPQVQPQTSYPIDIAVDTTVVAVGSPIYLPIVVR